jgi:hypothetical protein
MEDIIKNCLLILHHGFSIKQIIHTTQPVAETIKHRPVWRGSQNNGSGRHAESE